MNCDNGDKSVFFRDIKRFVTVNNAHNAPIQMTAILWRDWLNGTIDLLYVFNIRTRCYSLIRSHC